MSAHFAVAAGYAKPGAPSSTHSFIVRQAGVPGERLMLAGVRMGGVLVFRREQGPSEAAEKLRFA